MGRRIAGRRWLLAGMTISASLIGSAIGEDAPNKTTLSRLEPGTEIVLLPAAHYQPAAGAPAAPAPLPATGAAVPMLPPDIGGPGCGIDGCKDGPCNLYYRDRPRGCRDDKRHTIVQNRLGEPDWYKYYRREHFGYHPTTWMAWPENWLMCRNPVPGPHPYDLKQPESKADKKPKNSTDAENRSRVRQAPERLPVEKEEAPKPLPKKPGS